MFFYITEHYFLERLCSKYITRQTGFQKILINFIPNLQISDIQFILCKGYIFKDTANIRNNPSVYIDCSILQSRLFDHDFWSIYLFSWCQKFFVPALIHLLAESVSDKKFCKRFMSNFEITSFNFFEFSW